MTPNSMKQNVEVKTPKKELMSTNVMFTGSAVFTGILTFILIVMLHGKNDAHREGEVYPVVDTPKGRLKGLQDSSVGNQTFFSFYGIPFAKPPIGKLRLQDPIEEEAWTDIREATKPAEQCVQVSFPEVKLGILTEDHLKGSEDCLYLNVFTPTLVDTDALPVMVFLHGGGYVGGCAHLYQPHVLLDHQVVLVVPQFRLGALGFLSTEDEVIPGNYMLKDQLAALRWVRRNIEVFGGDPNRVTLFGESAGGSSLGLLVLSPKSKGLFSRVILQSGNALSPFGLGRRHRQTAEETAVNFGFSGKLDSRNILSFFQTVPAKSLYLAFFKYFEWYIMPVLTAPRVDGDVLPADPYDLFQNMKTCPEYDLMTGFTANDGGLLTLYFYRNENIRRRMMDEFSYISPLSLSLPDNDPDAPEDAARFYKYYLGDDINFELSDNYTELITDYAFSVPSDLTALAHAACTGSRRQTYSYRFAHRGQQSGSDALNVTIGKKWVTHMDDLIYLFPPETMLLGAKPLEDPMDLTMRRIMTKLWVNFATTGNPTPDDSMGFTWEAVKGQTLKHLNLLPQPAMQPDIRQQVREFYRTLLDRQDELLGKIPNLGQTCNC